MCIVLLSLHQCTHRTAWNTAAAFSLNRFAHYCTVPRKHSKTVNGRHSGTPCTFGGNMVFCGSSHVHNKSRTQTKMKTTAIKSRAAEKKNDRNQKPCRQLYTHRLQLQYATTRRWYEQESAKNNFYLPPSLRRNKFPHVCLARSPSGMR